MNISELKVILTEKDLLSIINDVLKNYVNLPQLKIDKLLIEDYLCIQGSYNYGINIPFDAKVSIEEVEDNRLYIVLQSINIKKIKIFNRVKNFILKTSLKKFKDVGITVDDNTLCINFYELCTIIPVVNFKLKKVTAIPFGLEVKFYDLNVDLQKNSEEKIDVLVEEKPEAIEVEEVDPSLLKTNSITSIKTNEKNCSSYSQVRNSMVSTVPNKYRDYSQYVLLLPDIIALLVRVFKDERVTKETKRYLGVALAYLFSPVDVIPDSIPLIGKIDDLAVVFFVFQKLLCDIPTEIIIDNYEGNEDIILIIKEGIALFADRFGTRNIKNIIDIVSLSVKKGINFFSK